MKVILTENQIRAVVQEEVSLQQVANQLQGVTNPNAILSYLSNAMASGLISLSSIPYVLNNIFPDSPQSEVQAGNIFDRLKSIWSKLTSRQENSNMENQKNDEVQDPNLQEKVNAVNEYYADASLSFICFAVECLYICGFV